MREIFYIYVFRSFIEFRRSCLMTIHHTRFCAEGQFIPTWHDFKPEFKPRRSKKRPIKMLTNRGKDENEGEETI